MTAFRAAVEKMAQCEAKFAYLSGTRYVPMSATYAAKAFLRQAYASCPQLGVASIRPLVRGTDAHHAVGVSCYWAWGPASFAVKFREDAGLEWRYRYGASRNEVMHGTGTDGLWRLQNLAAHHEATSCKCAS